MTTQSRRAHDLTATAYDAAARTAGWFPEALFGLCFDRLQPGQRVLSVGIGTGECARPFAAHGLTVWGVDESPAMLAVCRAKGVAERLVEHDLAERPWPFDDAAVTHVVASGVVHFLPDLRSFVGECRRVMRPDGLLAITTRAPRAAPAPNVEETVADGVPIYGHAPRHVDEVLAAHGLRPLKQLDVLLGDGDDRDVYRLTVAAPSGTA